MPETASQTPLFFGRAIPVIGDPTVALGAGMVALDEFPTVRVDILTSTRSGSDRSGHQIAGSAQTRGSRMRVQLTGYRNQVATLAKLVSDIVPVGEGFNLVDETQVIEQRTLAVVPLADKAGAIDSGGVFWLPSFIHEGDLSFLFDDTKEGADANETYTVTLLSLKTERDQADKVLVAGTREGFRGSPNIVARGNLGWSLPAAFAA